MMTTIDDMEGRRKVLVVDDDESMLGALEVLLRAYRERWEFAFAVGGEAAFAALRREHFDAVVTDLAMPGTDGHAVLAFAKQLCPDSARIVLSGSTFASGSIDADAILEKPCTTTQLMATLHEVATRPR